MVRRLSLGRLPVLFGSQHRSPFFRRKSATRAKMHSAVSGTNLRRDISLCASCPAQSFQNSKVRVRYQLLVADSSADDVGRVHQLSLSFPPPATTACAAALAPASVSALQPDIGGEWSICCGHRIHFTAVYIEYGTTTQVRH